MSTTKRNTADPIGTPDRRRARRPAGLARAAATGISIAGSVGIVGAMARAEQVDASFVEPADPGVGVPVSVGTTDTRLTGVPVTATTVVIEVHRTVYVDEFGNPVDPPLSATSPTSSGGSVSSPTAAAQVRTTRPPTATMPSSPVAPTTSAPRPPTTVRTPPPPPSCSGSNCP